MLVLFVLKELILKISPVLRSIHYVILLTMKEDARAVILDISFKMVNVTSMLLITIEIHYVLSSMEQLVLDVLQEHS